MVLAALGCSDPEPPAAEPAWHVLRDEGGGAILSAWSARPGEAYFVGGPLGSEGQGALALRWDGLRFSNLAPGGSETFWWVSGSGPDDVWIVGENGRIEHYDGARFTSHESGTTATLFGVVAFSKTEAFAVGGTPGGGKDAPNDVVLRWDGERWSSVALPGEPLGRALYKVWGSAPDDLFLVGEHGTIWRRTAEGFSLLGGPDLASGTLFTVHGCPGGDAYAVGGRDVLRWNGEAFGREPVELFNTVSGVACSAPGRVALVGYGGLKQRLVDGAWRDEFDVPPFTDLHAAWPESEGVYFAVGGDFLSKPSSLPRRGVVARFGPDPAAPVP